MQLTWRLLGVNDWSLRIVAPLFSLASLYLTGAIAKRLWPDKKTVAELTPYALLSSFAWMVYSTLTMFDIMLSFFVLTGVYSLLQVARYAAPLKYWGLLGIAIGGGVLTKGPVILLHLLPLALLAPWWNRTLGTPLCWRKWYGGVALAILIGAALALIWAIPAGLAGGEAYQKAIFLGQTSGRVVNSFAHRLPWWWYLPLTPLLLLPWPLFKPFWQAVIKLNNQDFGLRFCLSWIIPVFIAFSLVSGKRIHYLLPLLPAFALLLARLLEQIPNSHWRRAQLPYAAFLLVLGLALLLAPWLNEHFNWHPDLASLSPLWGLVLSLIALFTAIKPLSDSQQAAFYICISALFCALILSSAFFSLSAQRYDTQPAALKIAETMNKGQAIGFYNGKYHGQYHFTGRLSKPFILLPTFNDLKNFALSQKNCAIIVAFANSGAIPKGIVDNLYPYKKRQVGLISCQALLAAPELEPVLHQP
jgi:4-amino-4-deoxy-L-arabinose transferase-like glycosyltransferase